MSDTEEKANNIFNTMLQNWKTIREPEVVNKIRIKNEEYELLDLKGPYSESGLYHYTFSYRDKEGKKHNGQIITDTMISYALSNKSCAEEKQP